MVCIVGHYVIRHKARGECQERWELFPFPVSKDTFYIKTKKDNITRFSTFPVRSSHSCKYLRLIDYIVLKQETP